MINCGTFRGESTLHTPFVRSLVAGVASVAMLSLLASCTPGTPAYGSITGTVAITGESDASALVSVPGASVQTGSSGAFSFPSVPVGQVTVSASRAGYATASQTVTVTSANATSVTLTMTRAPIAPVIASAVALPPKAAPGSTILVTAMATSQDGFPLNYSWALPSGWKASGATNQSTLILTAPDQYSQAAVITVTVDDGHGASASASTVVTTSDDSAPTVSVTSTPSNPMTGIPVTFTAHATALNGQAVTYQWSLVQSPQGSKATLINPTAAVTTMTPDVVGDYAVQVVVTDAAGLSSTPAIATISVAPQPPTAVIAGARPLGATVNRKLLLDGSGSSGPPNDPLAYTWTVVSAPTQSRCLTLSCVTAVQNGATANFQPDVAGAYTVQLTVKDTITNLTASTTATVSAQGIMQLSLVSGGNQAGIVRQTMAAPIVVQVLAADGQTAVPSVPLTWVVTNGSTLGAPTATDANGTATTFIQGGRIAGAGNLLLYVTSMPSVSLSIPFTAKADQAAYYAIGPSTSQANTSDAPVVFNIQVVDQFGNPTTSNTAANAAAIALSLQAASGKAQFVVSPGLTLNNGQATATLKNGQLSLGVTETVAETLKITAGPLVSGPVLPFATWNTLLRDDAMSGMNNWKVYNTTGSIQWGLQNATVPMGASNAFGVTYPPGQQVASQETDLVSKSVLGSSTAAIVLLTMQSNVQAASAIDTVNNCQVTPYFRVRVGSSTYGAPVTPLGGYQAVGNCGSVGPSLSPTSGWKPLVADLTDALSTYGNNLQFQAAIVANANVPTPMQSATWAIDNVLVQALVPSTTATTTLSLPVAAGTAVGLQFNQPTTQGLFGQCLNGPGPFNLTAAVVDAHGNVAQNDATLQLTWSNNTGTITPTSTQGATATLVTQTLLQFQEQPGQPVQLAIADTVAEPVSFTLSQVGGSGSYAPVTVNATNISYHCHNNGLGTGARYSWSDGVPNNTFDQNEALNACQSYYGAGACAINSGANFAYPITLNPYYYNNYAWTYSPWSTSSGSCVVAAVNATAGSVYTYCPFAPTDTNCSTYACTGTGGSTSNSYISRYGSWN